MSDPLLERVRGALGQDFAIIRLLGQGGKVLDPELGASPMFRSRFQREADTAAARALRAVRAALAEGRWPAAARGGPGPAGPDGDGEEGGLALGR